MNTFYNVLLDGISQYLHYSSFMLRLQREFNIPSRSVEMKMSDVFEKLDKCILVKFWQKLGNPFQQGIRN